MHDFRKPGRLSAEWQHRLTGWYRQGFSVANKAWAKQLPFLVEASFLELDVCYAKETLAMLPEGVIGYRVPIAGGRLPTLLTLPRLLVLQLIGAMLGDSAAAGADREMTLVEENLADYFLVQYWLPYFRESWPSADAVAWQLDPREPNPQCSRLFAADDTLAVLHWQMRGPWGESTGDWFFQKKGLQQVLGDAASASEQTLSEPVIASRRAAIVSSLPLQVEFVLGTAELKLSQLSQLQVGDVVLLDQGNDDAVIARTEGKSLFRGKAGRQGTWKAFQIDSLDES